MSLARLVLVVLALTLNTGAHASPSSDALARCLSDSTSGKDRKDLAKWIFAGMSAHPDLGTIAQASAQSIEAAQRTVGLLVTRLIADSCAAEMRAVVKAEGNEGIKLAFEYLGKVAMQELTTNPQVGRAIGGFERFVDKPRIDSVMKQQ